MEATSPSRRSGESWPWPALASLDLESIYDELCRVDTLWYWNGRVAGRTLDPYSYGDAACPDSDWSTLDAWEEFANFHADMGYDTGYSELDRIIDARRVELRGRAMDLSRDKIRPLNLLDLPAEILAEVFHYVQDASSATAPDQGNFRLYKYLRNSADCLKILQNSRLVCRAFCDLASPLLLPVVKVQLDQGSLDRVDQISRSPLIAAGVRVIEVGLRYHPKEVATDFARFKAIRQNDVGELRRICNHRLHSRFSGNSRDSHGTFHPEAREYQQAIENYDILCRAWDALETPAIAETDSRELVIKYQRILLNWHTDYERKFEEQYRLIMDGSFVSILVSVMSRMPLCGTVRFGNGPENRRNIYHDERTALRLLTNVEELSGFKAPPLTFEEIETLAVGGAELFPAKILSELPTAMHKAGVPLRGLEINCFPHEGSYSYLSPGRQGQHDHLWAELRTACQQLELLQFGGESHMGHLPRRRDRPQAEDHAYADGYLGALLSGESLKVIDICLWGFSPGEGEDSHTSRHRIGEVFGAVKWPRLKMVTIDGTELHQDELERLCEGLGNGLERLCFIGIDLLSGSWAGALDILREKVASRGWEEARGVSFQNVRGGEFGDPFVHGHEITALIGKCEEYISGKGGAENPLKRDGGDST